MVEAQYSDSIGVGAEQLNALRMWQALEILSPQTYKSWQELADTVSGRAIRLNGKVPWNKCGAIDKGDKEFIYHVPLGSIDMVRSLVALRPMFGEDSEISLKTNTSAPLASVMVDRHGVPKSVEGVAIASLGFALPRILEGRFDTLSDWAAFEEQALKELKEILDRRDDDGRVLPLTYEHIQEMHAWLMEFYGLPINLVEPPAFVIAVECQPGFSKPSEALFLNSFLLEDLEQAIASCQKGTLPVTLRQYLQMDLPASIDDWLARREAPAEALRPKQTPAGRWPSAEGFPLAYLQQAAVNRIVESLADKPGIMAVNGPPGTGKTTLLRDIVAANVVARAEALSSFARPEQAFTAIDEKLHFSDKWYAMFHAVDPKLRGHEMLVVSNNNRAVENITKELPMLGAVDDPEFRYFRAVSDALQGATDTTWGLIAAVLGNGRNRGHFIRHFWWNKEDSMLVWLKGARGRDVGIDTIDPKTHGKRRRLPRILQTECPPVPHLAQQTFEASRAEFRRISEEVRRETERIEQMLESHRQLAAAQQQLELTQSETQAILEAERARKKEVEAAGHRCEQSNRRVAQTLQEIDACKSSRPGFWARLWRTERARAWMGVENMMHDQLRHLIEKRLWARQMLEQAQEELDSLRGNAHIAHERVEAARQAVALLTPAVIEARRELGDRILDDARLSGTHEALHLSTPWIPDSLHRKREALFKAALGLHKTFIAAAARPLQHNLSIMMEVLGNREMNNERQRAMLPHLWSTLFLVVPVISTAFASVGRMLKDLPAESLGWLFVDEAGQATPQSAVGALSRCKRAVVVGDPLQVPPVVTLPERLMAQLCAAFGDISAKRWAPPEASVQTLADSASPVQAEFDAPSGQPRRVGMPLLVHRRCQEPMGSICNSIAYDGQMVLAPGERKSGPIGRVLGGSAWLDVEGTDNNKWSAEEGHVAASLCNKLKEAGVTAPDLFIITPFRNVSAQLHRLARFGTLALPNHEDRIGTIHTFQGREADSVFLVLGAPGPESIGARRWATVTPNILNVAISRARQNLYVIGARSAWLGCGFARELEVLPDSQIHHATAHPKQAS